MEEINVSAVATESQEHPLKTSWDWAYKPTVAYKQQTAEEWLNDYLKTSDVIKTVEKFWGVYYNLPTLATLDYGNIYAVFRKGITASWEDKANEDGYSIIFYMNKHAPNEYITSIYQVSLLVLIGEEHENIANILNGCTFERKPGGNKVAFWMTGLGDFKSEGDLTQAMIDILSKANSEFIFSRDDIRSGDWKEDKLVTKKIVVKCISHRKRATEPVVIKPHQQQQHRGNQYRGKRNGDHGGRGRGRGKSAPHRYRK
jgi:hypothetical protein